jgi:hypothetical protein
MWSIVDLEIIVGTHADRTVLDRKVTQSVIDNIQRRIVVRARIHFCDYLFIKGVSSAGTPARLSPFNFNFLIVFCFSTHSLMNTPVEQLETPQFELTFIGNYLRRLTMTMAFDLVCRSAHAMEKQGWNAIRSKVVRAQNDISLKMVYWGSDDVEGQEVQHNPFTRLIVTFNLFLFSYQIL